MLLFRLDNAKKFRVFFIPRGVLGFDPHQCLQTETNSHFHFRLIHLDNRLEPRSRQQSVKPANERGSRGVVQQSTWMRERERVNITKNGVNFRFSLDAQWSIMRLVE